MQELFLEVIDYYKDRIKRSGFILDEDMITILYFDDWNIMHVTSKHIPYTFFSIGTFLFGCSYVLQKKQSNWTTLTSTAIASTMGSYFLNLLMKKRNICSLKNKFDEFLCELKSLSYVQNEVKEFFRNFLSEKSFEELISNTSKKSLFDLAKTSYECQFLIACELRNFFNEISETKIFESDNSIPVISEPYSVKECLDNENLIEGFIITLRSSLLTNIYYWCIKNPEFILEVIKRKFSVFIKLIHSKAHVIKSKLHSTHAPKKVVPSLETVENILEQKKIAHFGKLKKIMLKLNDNVYFTMLQTKSVLETVEKVQTENELNLIENQLTILIENISGCYVSVVEFKKLLEVLNGRFEYQANVEIQQNSDVEHNDEEHDEPVAIKTDLMIQDNLEENLNFQVFEGFTTEANSNDQINSHKIPPEYDIYKKSKYNDLNYSEWLMELKQSGEFKKRQTVFKIRKNSTCEKLADEAVQENISINFQQQQIPSPPPLQNESVSDVVPNPPPLPPPSMSSESEELTVLQNSLKLALNRFNNRQEDTFE